MILRALSKFRRVYGRLRGREESGEVDPRLFSYTEEDWIENQKVVTSGFSGPVRTITWFFIPSLGHPMGGMATIYSLAAFFAREKGVANTFVYCGNPSFTENDVRHSLGKLLTDANVTSICIGTDTDAQMKLIPPSDAAIATRWDTAYPLLRFRQAKSKGYLVQDYEPGFYPGGPTRAFAEATYSFGFKGFLNSPSLKERYDAWGGESMYFIPKIDRGLYSFVDPASRPAEKVRVFFYSRPGKPRNGFELGLALITELKAIYGERIEIITAGRDWDPKRYRVDGLVTNLGLIRDLKEVARAYQSCHLGISFLFSEGFPLSLLEFMATGAPIFTNKNLANEQFLKDGGNAVSSVPVIGEMVRKLRPLIDNPELRTTLAHNGQRMLLELDQERAAGHNDAAIWEYLSGTSR